MSPVSASLNAQTQGAFRTTQGRVRWCVWAPQHPVVHLMLGCGAEQKRVATERTGDGYHWTELNEIVSGTRYAYQLGDSGQHFPDPASRWQPDGVHHSSAVFFPDEFTWHDQHWRGLTMRDLVIYELHVGTFTPEGTFAAVIPRLSQLKDLGISAIEIMPISQFPGTRNWGYDGAHPYAAQNSYGGPQGLMQLVDAAHAAGLGVILDVVYNHLGPEGNYLGQFGPYFTDRHRTPWGLALNFDGAQSDPVRKFVIDNACQWIRDFHIDGLRLDAVQTIIDLSAYHLLAELQSEVQQAAADCGRSAVVIAETNENDAHLTRDVVNGGIGLDGVWSDDFHHSVHALLTGERDGYYIDFGEAECLAKTYRESFAYDGCYSPFFRRRHGSRVTGQPREKFVVCVQNHDQIGNRAMGDRLSVLISPAAQRQACALLLLSPFTPMLFMGEEYGETSPFSFFCSFGDPAVIQGVREGRKREFSELAFRWKGEIPDATAASTFEQARLSWKWEGDSQRSGLRQLYKALILARSTWPALVDREHSHAEVIFSDHSSPLLLIERGSGPRIVALANLSGNPASAPPHSAVHGEPILSTCERRFGGEREELSSLDTLLPHELVVWGDFALKT